ncbi:MAG: cysteine--tRNA ligase [Clostridiales bacterium]|nr:cysteine--tRNA ligase [Clostridiales bacterium]
MKIYNTITRKKEEFKPIDENELKIYVCGPTVYNYFHIGNARPFVIFDTLRRYLEFKGYNVKYVQNFTDVDDKIINRAREEKLTVSQVSEKYIKEYFKDAGDLNIKNATVHPRVTENMEDIIQFISGLIEKGYAYVTDGDVYFDTKKFKDYGKLSRQNMNELDTGARVEVDSRKRNPMDFALWKAQKKEDEIAWEAPWGKGRPGWHIECSVMATKYLGETIDIHAGGQDLVFPHHENEVAQSEALTGKPFANYWMHNEFINIDNEKMSKSKGNFFMVRDILKEYEPEVVRFFLISGHYRSPINFSRDLMIQSKNALARLNNAKVNMEYFLSNAKESELQPEEADKIKEFMQYKDKFIESMEDDLNTADAISAVFELVREINSSMTDKSSRAFVQSSYDLFMELVGVLGILQKSKSEEVEDEVQKLVDERQLARKNRDFARADEIRDILKAKGITLEDTPQGVRIIREN